MKITPSLQNNSYTFNIEKEGKHYHATIWMNDASSKFQDWEVVNSFGDKVDFDTEDEIIGEIDRQWAELVG